ncbi:DUF4190 domain-containing protein [Streptomyces rhizosphaerihabitans]|uniref:DUF4190 domain-containing protein n=1 Tax=Streptomyces rhizosphaerihabitans TaxID=1266770 RepID=UPI0021C1E751|nr:DUF4190 domain-containing protein [Streptomyces rhizosphaerihabitans]MCT9003887.1 DUF4190 domain-containing protein [Streptomyces rhizosphaerihabitans]
MAIPPPPGPQQPEGQYPPPGTPPGAPGTPPGAPGAPGAYPSPYPHAPYPQGPQAPHQQGPFPQGAYQQSPYAGPYQPWGQGYSPYNRPVPFNGFAIAALVLGILCFLPAVGLVLGIVALVQIKRRGERGKGMAVGGMVMSSIGVVLLALMVATGGAGDFWDGVEEGAGGSGSTFSLHKGECFNAQGDTLEGLAYDVDTVPCAGKHDAEVFAEATARGDSYPGDSAVSAEADDKCYALADTYAMDAWAVPDDVDIYYFTPTRQSWHLGDREITCMFGNTDEQGTLTGSLRKDATTLDADQLAYLKAARILNRAMDSAPEKAYVEDDLPGHRKWATRVSGALAEQAGLLRGHTFAPAASELVAALVKDLDRSRKEWAKAADAPDADTFYAHYEKGVKLIDADKTVTTRKALGLATTPPKYDEGGGGGSGGEGGGGMEV